MSHALDFHTQYSHSQNSTKPSVTPGRPSTPIHNPGSDPIKYAPRADKYPNIVRCSIHLKQTDVIYGFWVFVLSSHFVTSSCVMSFSCQPEFISIGTELHHLSCLRVFTNFQHFDHYVRAGRGGRREKA